MDKLKLVLKAFVVIAVMPILVFGGIIAASFVAPLCFGDISHPLFGFLAVILMLPWGFIFSLVVIIGVGTAPTFVIKSTGNGGYLAYQKGENGVGFFINLIKFVLMVPLALLIWVIVSIILIFNQKTQNKIEERYVQFIKRLKKWYKFGIVLFVIAPLIVLGLNQIENALYSPKNIQLEIIDLQYDGVHNDFYPELSEYHPTYYYDLDVSIDTNDKDIVSLVGYWEFIDKNTGKSVSFKERKKSLFSSYGRFGNQDKSTKSNFSTTVLIPSNNEDQLEILSNDLEDIKIVCHITSITYNSNIPILGDWLFPYIDNKYEEGYKIVVKP